MSMRDLVMIIADLSLIFTGYYFGYRFLKLGNRLLGWEWVILAFSASNLLVGILLKNAFFEGVAFYCDAFSRGVGFPVIATLGFVELFRGRKFSWQFDVAAFVGGAIFAWAARTVWADSQALQQFYMVAFQAFNVCMLYFAARLFAVRLVGHCIAIIVGLIALFGTGLLEGGFIVIPGEETNIVFNWMTIDLCVWALVFAHYFFAYRAYEAVTGGRRTSGDAGYRYAGRTAST
jgi:hypothetical protein